MELAIFLEFLQQRIGFSSVRDSFQNELKDIRGLSKKYPNFGGEKYISYVTGLGP